MVNRWCLYGGASPLWVKTQVVAIDSRAQLFKGSTAIESFRLKASTSEEIDAAIMIVKDRHFGGAKIKELGRVNFLFFNSLFSLEKLIFWYTGWFWSIKYYEVKFS